MTRLAVALLSFGLLTTLAACGSGASPEPAGQAGHAFTVTTTDGDDFSLAAQHGKPVVVCLTAIWCGTRVAGATNLAHIHAAHPDIAVLALDVDPANDSPAAIHQFRQSMPGATYRCALDVGGKVTHASGVKPLADSVALCPNGTVLFHNDTSPTATMIEQDIQMGPQR